MRLYFSISILLLSIVTIFIDFNEVEKWAYFLVAVDDSNVGFHDTDGGKHGRVIYVTNLNSEGRGSLKWALNNSGPRVIKFKVGGVLDLSGTNLYLKNPHVTLDGASAPSPGITVIRGSLNINTHDVIVRHIRFRPGDYAREGKRNWEPDGITVAHGSAHNILLDHVSVSWSVDENISVSGVRDMGYSDAASNVTISNSIIAEGLSNSIHSKGEHSKGILIHDFVNNVAILGNLLVSNYKRNPYFKSHTSGVIGNNLIYNPGRAAIQLDYIESEFVQLRESPKAPIVSIVGNVFIHGEDTLSGLNFVSGRGEVYLEDNVVYSQNGALLPSSIGDGIVKLAHKPIWLPNYKPLSSSKVEKLVLTNSGARPWDRDYVDSRLILNVINRNSTIIDSQDDVGGYPLY